MAWPQSARIEPNGRNRAQKARIEPNGRNRALGVCIER